MTDALIHSADDRRAAKRAYDRARYLRLRAERQSTLAPDPIAELAPTDLAYLAGLTDADGSIYVTHTNRLRTYYPTVCWAMTHKATIRWVSEVVGGGDPVLHNHTNLRRGATSWGSSTFREQWRTQVSGSRARLLCERMLPYMRTKTRQAELVAIFPVDERKAPGVRLSDAVRLERERIGAEISRINQGG
jgi:hypothetical protein